MDLALPRGVMAGPSQASVSHLCRLCYTETDYKHCTGLFTGIKNRAMTSRMCDLLQILIEENDGLPSMVCRKCLGKFNTIESKLDSLRSLAQSSYEAYLKANSSVCTRKRPKVTSGIGVSPSTSRVQPLPKRFQRDLSGKKLRFDRNGII